MEKQKPDLVIIRQFDNQQPSLRKYLLRAVLEWQQECNGEAFNLETTPAELLDDLIKVSNNGVLYVAESKDGKCIGFTGVVIFKNPLGTEMIANEHYWYVIKKYRTGIIIASDITTILITSKKNCPIALKTPTGFSVSGTQTSP